METEHDLNAIRFLGALTLASIGKCSREQLLDAALRWAPVMDMVEQLAKG